MNRPILQCPLHRRPVTRYELHLPAVFSWEDGCQHTGTGFTIDVALDGASISSKVCPPVGAVIHVEILIPVPDQSGAELAVELRGRVMQTVEHPECGHFGVKGSFDDEHLTRRVLERRTMNINERSV